MQRHSRSQRVWRALGGRSALLTAALVGVVVAIVVSQLRLIGDYRVDDAYISFAFAKNLVAGHGLTYGAGLRVEGYSNFLWTMIAALVQWLVPNRIYFGMRLVALGCLALTLLFTFRLSARYTGKYWAWCPVLSLACATDLTGAAQSALETVAYVAALVITAYYYLAEDPRCRRSSGWALLSLGLIRIDGVVHVAFFLGWSAACWLLERRPPRLRETLKWLGGPALLYFAYFSWRYAYYGLPLPTTYYAKSLIHVLLPDRGYQYVRGAARQLGLVGVGSLGLIGAIWRPKRERSLLSALVLYHLAYISYVGGDWMPFHRFILPILPFMAVLYFWGAFEIWQLALRTQWWARISLGLALAAGTGYVAVLQDGHQIDTPEEDSELNLRRHVARHTRGLLDASWLFRWVTRKPGEKFVTDYGGVFAYYTDAFIIEMWGLCNADIALYGNTEGVNPIYGKTCVACYRDFQPDYFHANVPLLRPIDALHSQSEVLAQIFQAGAIGRVLDLTNGYVTGRVVDRAHNLAFYFIERRRNGLTFTTRSPAPGIEVEYPFDSAVNRLR